MPVRGRAERHWVQAACAEASGPSVGPPFSRGRPRLRGQVSEPSPLPCCPGMLSLRQEGGVWDQRHRIEQQPPRVGTRELHPHHKPS